MANVTGTSRMTYKPGEKLPESLPVEAGVYDLQLTEFGKKGRPGWAAKPGKFHNRRLVFEILGTSDELTGLPKKVSEFFTLGPKNLFRVLNLAQAAQYPEELTLDTGYTKPGAPQSLANADAVDEMLEWIKSSKLTLRAQLGVDEYQGREQNRIQRWLDTDAEGEVTEGEEQTEATEEAGESAESLDEEQQAEETTEEASEEASEEAEAEEEQQEEEQPEPPKKPAPKPAAKAVNRVVQGPIGKGGKVTPIAKPAAKPAAPKGKLPPAKKK